MKRVVMPICEISELMRAAPVISNLEQHFPQKVRLTSLYLGLPMSARETMTDLLSDQSITAAKSEYVSIEDADSKVDSYYQAAKALAVYLDQYRPDLYLSQGNSLPSFLMTREAFIRRIPILNFCPESTLFEFSSGLPSQRRSYRKMLNAMANFTCVANEEQSQILKKNGFHHHEVGVTGNTTVDVLKTLASGLSSFDGLNPSPMLTHKRILIYLGHELSRVRDTKLMDLAVGIARLAHAHPDLKLMVMISPNFNMSTSIRYALAAIPQISVIEYPDYLELIEAIMDSDLVITSNDQIACEVRALERGYICLDHDLAELIKKAQLPETALQSSDHGLDSFNTSLQDLKLILSYDNPERLPRVQTNYGDGKAGFRIAKLIDNWARNHVFTPHAYDPWH